MLQMLALTPSDTVMEIGTGSGFQTKQLAETGATIHSIELEPWIDSTVITGGCVYLHRGDGSKGIDGYGPFTAIVATCGVEQIPHEWVEQLGEGGRLVAPIGDARSQRLTLFHKQGFELVPVRIGAYVRFQMMRDKPGVKPPKYQPNGQN
jgi:protein-L-isoaspartate(D-aspartate) O-methyltransferase